MKMKISLPCLFGLEGILSDELKRNRFEGITAKDGSVSFTGDMRDVARANILLRTAERVNIVIGEFKAVTFDELFEKTKSLEWENWIDRDSAFPVTGYSLKSKLHSVPDCQSIIKKAVADRLGKNYGTKWLEESGTEHRIRFSILNDFVTLMLDTTGTPLYKRGYRTESTGAPIRETLAAGLVYISRYRYFEHFCDPMCGSGTIPIEAAMIAKNIAPGLKRSFACEAWKRTGRDVFADVRNEAQSRIYSDKKFEIFGSDIDPSAVKTAEANAQRCGVASTIRFRTADVAELSMDASENNVIVCNPPYGERLSTPEEVAKLTGLMGSVFEKIPRHRAYIISSFEDFEKCYGRKADKNRKLYNGMIKTYLYQYFGKD